jgi:processive 1,2-diacylglycerol beta-glucosyltransferase
MKVLVIYATAGAGHKMAAQAVYNGLKGQPGVEAVFVDSLDYTSAYYKYLYSRVYTLLITRAPWAWGFFFWLLDRPVLQPLVRLARRIQNSLQANNLHRYLVEQQFDYIISSHFFPNEVAGFLKRTGKIKSRIICCVTDFDVHRIWLSAGVDFYTVACGSTQKKMAALAVPPEKVIVAGIPTDQKFSRPRDIAQLRRQLGLESGIFTVLIATGSFGIGPIAEIVEALPGFQIMVVCGHNKNLYQKLSGLQSKAVKIFGLVNNMDELMAASDAMITKPGGLSISEALVTGLPMIFFNAIPGQEENNVRVLRGYGVGGSNCPISEMTEVLLQWQAQSVEFAELRNNIRSLAKPSAVKDIIALLE